MADAPASLQKVKNKILQRGARSIKGISWNSKVKIYFQGWLDRSGLAQSVERLTAEREVAGSIPGTVPDLRSSMNNWEMKVVPLDCKGLDLCLAGMTT